MRKTQVLSLCLLKYYNKKAKEIECEMLYIAINT